MRDVALCLGLALGIVLLALLIAGCGGNAENPGQEANRIAAPRARAGSPVASAEDAVAAVRSHLDRISSCQAARDRVDRDIAAGRFNARQVFGYRTQNPLWEVAVAGDMHIPYLMWYVEQGDGTVLPSIAAATYYQSPLLHLCGQIYGDNGGTIPMPPLA